MLQDFQNISFQTTRVGDVVAALIVAFLCGFMVLRVFCIALFGISRFS